MGKIKVEQPNWIFRFGLISLTRLMVRFPSVARRVRVLADTEDFVTWVRQTFGEPERFHAKREQLWDSMMKQLNTDSWTAWEFGVAWGYATNYWLSREKSKIQAWHGFDRFTGLPRAWRGLDEGHFDAGGQAPQIDDRRIS